MSSQKAHTGSGPFCADQLRDGDRYELADGHPIYCAPSGPEHASRSLTGGAVIASDPDVDWAGVDAGFAPDAGTLWAPDIAVAPAASADAAAGWMPGVPPLALEYAGTGQDEAVLGEKIADLLARGTRLVWVVRLIGPRRVEVHAPDAPVRTLGPGDQLEAPGILRNPGPVEALYDRAAGHSATLRNLLQRQGYADLDDVLERGRQDGVLDVAARGDTVGIAGEFEWRGACRREHRASARVQSQALIFSLTPISPFQHRGCAREACAPGETRTDAAAAIVGAANRPDAGLQDPTRSMQHPLLPRLAPTPFPDRITAP